MKKYLIVSIGLMTISAPLGVAVSCGNSSSGTATHTITKETQRFIQNKLNEIKDPLGNLVEGKIIRLSTDVASVEKKISEITNKVTVVDLLIEEKAKTGGDWTATSEYQSVSKDYTYKLTYILGLKPGNKWEGTNNKHISFTGQTKDSKSVSATLDENDFKNLSFKNLSLNFDNPITYEDLEIDDTGKSWSDKVDLKLFVFNVRSIGDTNWYHVNEKDNINPGTEIAATIVVIPKDNFAWKDGTFEEKIIQNAIVSKAQFKLDVDDMKVRYPEIVSASKININLYLAWSLGAQDPNDPDQQYVEVKQVTSKTASSADPASLIYNTDVDIKAPNTFDHDSGKTSMAHDIVLTLPSDDKFVNLEVRYKNFLKVDNKYPFSFYDRTGLLSLPIDDPTNKRKLVKDGDDLVLYSYPIQYKLFGTLNFT